VLRDLTKKGFASIVEVIITSVIFVIAAAAVLSTTSQFRPQGQESSQKMEAAYIGKGIIDDFRQQVSAEDWNTGNLAVGTRGLVNGDYTINYTITEPIPDLRHITMNITWPGP
jgi:Tfp pilus assembly protein PilV